MGTEKNIQKNNGTGVRVQAQPSGIKTELSRLARNIESKWIGRMNRWPEIAREPIRLEIINTCCFRDKNSLSQTSRPLRAHSAMARNRAYRKR